MSEAYTFMFTGDIITHTIQLCVKFPHIIV